MQEEYTLKLPAQMLQIIMGALAEGKYRSVAHVIQEIDRQVTANQNAVTPMRMSRKKSA